MHAYRDIHTSICVKKYIYTYRHIHTYVSSRCSHAYIHSYRPRYIFICAKQIEKIDGIGMNYLTVLSFVVGVDQPEQSRMIACSRPGQWEQHQPLYLCCHTWWLWFPKILKLRKKMHIGPKKVGHFPLLFVSQGMSAAASQLTGHKDRGIFLWLKS